MPLEKPSSNLPKRFYKSVSIESKNELYQILLDGRTAKTKSGIILGAKEFALANAIQQEWDAQETHIDYHTMPMMRLQTTILEMLDETRISWRDGWEGEIERFLKSDLLCYRAASPEVLVDRETQLWDPFLDYVKTAYGLAFNVTNAVLSIEQPSVSLEKAMMIVKGYPDPILLSVRRITELTGSAILGLCVGAGFRDAQSLVQAALLDEEFQASQWGVDEEARERLNAIEQEIKDAITFANLNETPRLL